MGTALPQNLAFYVRAVCSVRRAPVFKMQVIDKYTAQNGVCALEHSFVSRQSIIANNGGDRQLLIIHQ